MPRDAKLVNYNKVLLLTYRKKLEIVRFRESLVFGVYHDDIRENKNLIELLKKEYHFSIKCPKNKIGRRKNPESTKARVNIRP